LYFNKKYERTGPLFQGTYKAVLVDYDSQFLELTRYIHKQALSLQGVTLQGDQPSSYPEYIGKRKTPWIHPEDVLAHFSNANPSTLYETFVKNTDPIGFIEPLLIENESMQGYTLHGKGKTI
jgi:hypothetical protein